MGFYCDLLPHHPALEVRHVSFQVMQIFISTGLCAEHDADIRTLQTVFAVSSERRNSLTNLGVFCSDDIKVITPLRASVL